jgi:hypothetical protein
VQCAFNALFISVSDFNIALRLSDVLLSYVSENCLVAKTSYYVMHKDHKATCQKEGHEEKRLNVFSMSVNSLSRKGGKPMSRLRVSRCLAALVLPLALLMGLRAQLTVRAKPAGDAYAPVPQTATKQFQEALGTAFTYQGYLQRGEISVTEHCDFQFSLYDAASGGALIGAPSNATDVAVDKGYFTVVLDFGADVFSGDARWMAIAVRCPTDVGSYVFLEPRQALTASPYALFAQRAPWHGLQAMPAGFADGVDDVASVVSSTTVFAGPGLHRITTSTGITLSLTSSYRLPQTCATGQIAAWDGAAWACGENGAGGHCGLQRSPSPGPDMDRH